MQRTRGARNALPCRHKLLHVLTALTTLRSQYKKLTAPVIVLPKLARTSISCHTAGSPLCLPSASPFFPLSSLRIGKAVCSGESTCNMRSNRNVSSCAQRISGVRGNNKACSFDETAQTQTDPTPNAKIRVTLLLNRTRFVAVRGENASTKVFKCATGMDTAVCTAKKKNLRATTETVPSLSNASFSSTIVGLPIPPNPHVHQPPCQREGRSPHNRH